jgi:hypothetical protein
MFARAERRPRLALALELLPVAAGLAFAASIVACGDRDLTGIHSPSGAPARSLDFTAFGTQPITTTGTAAVRSGQLILTNGGSQIGAAWFGTKQRLSATWETSFQFQISGAGCSQIADGFAFVIQNHSATALMTGTSGSDLGYSGLRSALAVEFDVFQSTSPYPDPDGNHIAVIGMKPGFSTISASNPPLKLMTVPSIKDGNVHTVRIRYGGGNMDLFYDGGLNPLFTLPLNLLNINGANILDANGAAWVGFTAATGGACAQFKILSWSLVDNKAPSATAGGTIGEDGIARYDAVEGSPLTLTASGTDPDGDPIASYEWDYNNDGTIDEVAATPTVQHTFNACGTVPISVIAVDAFGSRSAPAPAQVTVANVNPVVSALPELQATPGTAMSVSATFSDAGADGPWSYHIDWGDGTAGADGTTSDASAALSATHTYGMSQNRSYPLTVTVRDKCGGTGTAQGQVQMTAIAANVILGNLQQVFDGQAKPVAVTTAPADLPVQVTYDGSSTVPTNAGSYWVVATVNDPNYVGSASGQLIVSRAPVQVQLGGLTGQTYDGSPKAVSVSTQPADVPVAVTYDGLTTPPTDPGSYAVSAMVSNPNYDGGASGTLVVAKAHATLVIDQLEYTYDGAPKAARVSSEPAGLGVVTVTYNGSTATPVGAGSYTVAASLANKNYGADPATATLVIHKASQSLTFSPLPNRTYGDAPFTLVAQGGRSTSPISFSVGASSVGCSVSGAVVTIIGATPEGGACTIVAHQDGDANFTPASDVAQSFTIAKATPVIIWPTPADLAYGAALSPAQFNATARGVGGATIPGYFAYTPTPGTVLGVGSYTLNTTFTPTSGTDYRVVTASVPLRVVYLTSPGHALLPPFDVRATLNLGPRVDVAFQLFKADGVTPVTSARATITVQPLFADGSLGAPIALSNGNTFVYDAYTGSYRYDLRTGAFVEGTYSLRVALDDGSMIYGEMMLVQGRGHTDPVTTTAQPIAGHTKTTAKTDAKQDPPRRAAPTDSTTRRRQ